MSQGKLNIEKSILEQFWVLAESNEQGILSSTEKLTKQLANKQENLQGETCKELKYSVDRLVKGLASSRQSARHGFSVALCQILRNFSTVTVDSVLQAVAMQLKYTQKESKSEQGNILLGKTLAYLALIQSGRLCQNQESQLQKVTKHLLEIKKKKSYLQQICTNAVALAISQVDTETFKGYIYPEIESDLIQGWEACTPDSFLLLLSCYKHQSETVNKKFLKQYWHCSKLISNDNFERLWKIIMQTAVHPVRHMVVDQIVDGILEMPSSVSDFWSCGLDLTFGKAPSSAALGLHVLLKILPCVQSVDQVNSILVPSVFDTLTKAVDSKKKSSHPLHTVAKETIEALTLTIKQFTDGDLQLAVLKCLEASSLRMGKEMNVIKDSVLSSLKPDAVKTHSQHLLKVFHKLNKQNEDEENDAKIFMVITDIRTLVSLQSMIGENDWQIHLLKFLAVHSYWNVTKKTADLAHCEKETKTLSTAVRKLFQDSFFRTLDNLLLHKGERSKSTALNDYIDNIYQLCMYMKELTERETCVAWTGANMQKKVLNQWDISLSVISSIKEKLKPEESSGIHHCLALLILYHCVQLLVQPRNHLSVLEDLRVCHEKITKAKGRKSSKEEPKWIEVIMEVLLSMMSQGSNLARVTAKAAFGLTCEHTTPDSLKFITEVLDAEKLGGDDEGPIAFEDDQDMEDDDDEEDFEEDVEEDENTCEDEKCMDKACCEEDENEDVNENEDESESSEEEEEEEEEVEEEGQVDDTFRDAVRTALGDAAVKNDDDENEDDSDDDLSDSEMFKFDEALAAVFRDMQRGKTKTKAEMKRQLNTFKIRVLDLVEVLVKSQPKGDLIMDLIFPLLRLMMSQEKDKDQRQIGHKAENVLKMLYKKAEVHGQIPMDKERYVEGIKEAIEMSTKVLGHHLVLCVSNATLLMVRLLLNLEMESAEPSPQKTRSQRVHTEKISTEEQSQKDKERLQQEMLEIIGKRLIDLVHKNESKLHQGFFENMFTKYPVLFWPMTDILLKAGMDKDIKVFGRSQAVSLLIPFVNKVSASHLGEEKWSTFTDGLMGLLTKVMEDTEKETFKQQLVKSTYQVIIKRINIGEDLKGCSNNVLDKMESLNRCYNMETRKLCKKIVSKFRPLQNTSTESKKTAKKRVSEATSNGAVKKERLK